MTAQPDHPRPLDGSQPEPILPQPPGLPLGPVMAAEPTEATPEQLQSMEAPPLSQKFWAVVREIVETVVMAAIIWGVVNLLTVRVMVVSISMEPNLFEGERLIVSRLAYVFGEPQRGDVIVFHSPNNLKENLVKRIIGLPGETLTIEGGKVYINGQPLNEPYLAVQTTEPEQGHWIIPEGHYFVMGDNRPRSGDSRTWGLLAKEEIIGKAWVVYWPPQAWGLAPHYDFTPDQ